MAVVFPRAPRDSKTGNDEHVRGPSETIAAAPRISRRHTLEARADHVSSPNFCLISRPIRDLERFAVTLIARLASLKNVRLSGPLNHDLAIVARHIDHGLFRHFLNQHNIAMLPFCVPGAAEQMHAKLLHCGNKRELAFWLTDLKLKKISRRTPWLYPRVSSHPSTTIFNKFGQGPTRSADTRFCGRW